MGRVQGNGLVAMVDKVLEDQPLDGLVKVVDWYIFLSVPKRILACDLSRYEEHEGSDVIHDRGEECPPIL